MADVPKINPDQISLKLKEKDGKVDPEVSAGEVYRFLYTYYMHQDRLSWDRVRLILIIESATLGASYSIWTARMFVLSAFISLIIFAFGTMFIWILVVLIGRDWELRDHNRHILDKVHGPLGIRFTPEADGSESKRSGSFLLRAALTPVLTFNIISMIVFCVIVFGEMYRRITNG